MELLFNLVWLALSLGLLTSLGCKLARHSGHAVTWRQRYFAAIVLSFLLLPVISMTDDLHAMTAMAESERSSDRRTCTVQTQAPQHHVRIHPAFSAAPSETGAPLACVGQVAVLFSATHTTLPPCKPHSDRAPPSLPDLSSL